jgi:glycogen debranching enzyme
MNRAKRNPPGKRYKRNRVVQNCLSIGQVSLCICILLTCSFAQESRPKEQSNLEQSLSDRLAISTDSVEPIRFIAAHGRRAVIMGYPATGLECWVYPFQIFSDYTVGFRRAGATTESDGRLQLRRIIYEPQAITRIYIGLDYMVHEKLFVPLDQPGVILSYEVEGQPVDIQIHFTPVLNLMWPAAMGGQYTRWHPELSGYVISEPLQSESAVVASPQIVAHDDTVNTTLRTTSAISFSIRPVVSGKGLATAAVYVALGAGDSKNAAATLREVTAHQTDMEVQAVAHYAELERNALLIRTPDEDINRALAWAEIALDQTWVCNPRIGCGIVAGYGPSRDARRPQYDWFFGGDGLVATHALLAAGEYARAREELEFIIKYQDQKTGMVWHELSQSAGYMDWSKYPYMYVHVDISFDYLNTVARYVAASGDTAFAIDHWSSIAAAYRYCQALINTSDNLPHIPADKEGGNEQDRPDDDLSLSSSWVAVTGSFADLATVTGHPQLVDEARKANQLARAAIAERYWDSAHHYLFEGHTRSGRPIFGWRKGPGLAITQNIFSPEQNEELLNEIASADFQADWGTRAVATRSEIYDPNSYGKGSVWALGTAETATTYWEEHRPNIAFGVWKAMLPWNSLDSIGHIHEVLAGNFYHEEEESVPEQTWSSAGFLDAAVRGLTGLDIQGTRNSLHFAPHLPAQWNRFSVEHVHLPKSTLALSVSQSINEVDLDIQNEGSPASIQFEPQIPLGARIVTADFDGRPVAASPELFPEDEHAKMEIEARSGTSHCHVRFAGGVSLILTQPSPHLGDSSTGLKLTKVNLQNQVLSIDADVSLGGNAAFLMQTPWKIATLKGATSRPLSDTSYEITMQRPSAPADRNGYARVNAEISFTEK